ncbi:MAG TPA: winged helix-turn-helix domain-containing protein [Bryobacteraceae bacterium]|jgi:two-component system copper resistance phosphate regulon response regulator CusR|nr:winged helix-turn-helix domain-containing protein [Bryobacteraceae bacterium]
MRILLVDDESKAAAYLRKGLAENGFAVDVARQGQNGLELAHRSDYDLMVVNCMLEWPVFSELRRSGKHTPVLFLAAGGRAEGPVRGFSDFLTRIHSALGWGKDHGLEKLQIADLEIDLMRQRAVRAGRRLDLTHKEFLLLSLLARRAGEVLSRTFIADQVWDINFDSNTNFVDVHIRRLRSKLDDPFEKKLIHTARGRGYVLEERA